MERLRNINAGLGQYCLQLGMALAKEPAAQAFHFECYLPNQLTGILGQNFAYRSIRKWHKLTGVQTDAAIWHCTHQETPYFPLGNQTNVVMTIHDLNFMERGDYPNWKKALKIKRLQQKINRCKGIVYISEYVKDAVQKHMQMPQGIQERVIYNGIAVANKGIYTAVPSMPPYVFSIGMHPKKNYAVGLPILQSNPDLQWVIAGNDDGGYQDTLLKAAQKLGVEARLTFKGTVTEEEKWSLYQNCKALIFPSVSEGFGMPVLEAMSFGKPVFLSNRTSLPEIGGPEAYYFEHFEPEYVQHTFAAGMQNFQADAAKSDRMKQYASQFNWETAAKQYIQFYSEINAN